MNLGAKRIIVAWRRYADDIRRIGILVTACLVSALLVVDFENTASNETLAVGDVVPRSVKASHTFQYADFARQKQRIDEARDMVPPVFLYDAAVVTELQERLAGAFAAARVRLEAEATLDEPLSGFSEWFIAEIGVHIPEEDTALLVEQRFPESVEAQASDLLGRAMRGYVIADKAALPSDRGPVSLIAVHGNSSDREEQLISDGSAFRIPDEVREQIATIAGLSPTALTKVSVTLAQALVRPNVTEETLLTLQRQEEAAKSVIAEPITVKRGEILFGEGVVLTEKDLEIYQAHERDQKAHSGWLQPLSVFFFLLLVFGTLVQFGSSYVQNFSNRVRDVGAVAAVLVLVAVIARLVVAFSGRTAEMIGLEAEASSVWFVVPVAGAAMLVRLLIGVPWTMVFSIAAATVCGLIMDAQALHVVFFVVSGVAAAAAIEHTRERLAVLRAGLFTGVVNAATVLLIHFLQLYATDGEVSLATTMRPVWSMAFAFIGGIASGFLVLGLMPLFEASGFVTDYRLMELANLSHPLLKQLMLRAPGSYHHSVIVGSLAEAACEAIGANALQARVAAFFHDIGKTVKPPYFVENQRGMVNRHDTLDPRTSASIILNHVSDGVKLAKEHKLPQPIIDNIYMHHGTGLLQYFYARAVATAGSEDAVDEREFRYAGPKPNTREAGILMLADKAEAGTRTLREPTEENIRSMIHSIINSVMADGQFEECSLTFREITTVAQTFVTVLVGIYHQRIEYPATRAISEATAATPAPAEPKRVAKGSVITLEIPSAFKGPQHAQDLLDDPTTDDTADPETDYESVKNLPRRS